MSRTDLPVRAPADFPDEAVRPRASVRGVLLAAGRSSRFGSENKLLATLEGEPLVAHAARSLLASAVDGVTVVVGHERERVAEALADFDVAVRVNEAYADGQSTSVRVGVRDAAARGADAVLVALGDMPCVASTTNDLLVEAYRRGVADVLVAAYEGRRGNPVVFDARFFEALTAVDGDVGGRELLLESGETVAIETGDPCVLRDVDRPSDLDGVR